MRSALLTGATGFLGSHLLRRLLSDDWDVFALKRSHSQLPPRVGNATKLRWFDVDQPSGILDAFEVAKSIDVVFHLATSYGRKESSSAEIVQSNVVFPLEILEIALRRRVGLFVNTDTCFKVEYPYLRTYTLSKKQFAEWGRILSSESDMRFVNLELQHPFGPGDRPGKFVPWIIEQCRQDRVSIAMTSGEQLKDFVYVEDVVDALLAVAEHGDAIATGYQHFECGRGEPMKLRQFVEIVHRVCRSNCKLDFGAMPYRPFEIMHSAADIQNLLKLQWKPKWSIEDGIASTVAEYTKHATK